MNSIITERQKPAMARGLCNTIMPSTAFRYNVRYLANDSARNPLNLSNDITINPSPQLAKLRHSIFGFGDSADNKLTTPVLRQFH